MESTNFQPKSSPAVQLIATQPQAWRSSTSPKVSSTSSRSEQSMKPVPISVDPEVIKVAASGGNSSFRMMNDCPERRYCFKVKSTNNDHYR
ncbi:hypothetical protein ACQ4LE_008790 [Meloidogyne hapla]